MIKFIRLFEKINPLQIYIKNQIGKWEKKTVKIKIGCLANLLIK